MDVEHLGGAGPRAVVVEEGREGAQQGDAVLAVVRGERGQQPGVVGGGDLRRDAAQQAGQRVQLGGTADRSARPVQDVPGLDQCRPQRRGGGRRGRADAEPQGTPPGEAGLERRPGPAQPFGDPLGGRGDQGDGPPGRVGADGATGAQRFQRLGERVRRPGGRGVGGERGVRAAAVDPRGDGDQRPAGRAPARPQAASGSARSAGPSAASAASRVRRPGGGRPPRRGRGRRAGRAARRARRGRVRRPRVGRAGAAASRRRGVVLRSDRQPVVPLAVPVAVPPGVPAAVRGAPARTPSARGVVGPRRPGTPARAALPRPAPVPARSRCRRPAARRR
ncbi:hypothetical protein ACFQ0M_14040 [Kitasatospora aburaviensis]